MVELPALTRARQIRLACQASSRRAGWEFRRACAQASSIGHWVDEGENVIRLGAQWGGLGLTLVSLFYPGKKVAGHGLGLAGRILAGLRLVQQIAQAWGRVKKS
jgi:hypothetical protein